MMLSPKLSVSNVKNNGIQHGDGAVPFRYLECYFDTHYYSCLAKFVLKYYGVPISNKY